MLGLDNPIHIMFLLLLVLLVFGAKRLPEMGRSLGTGLRGFKESLSGEHNPVSSLTAGEPEHAQAVHASSDPAPVRVPVDDASAPQA
ncbi:MAG: twin-arginine translocase TatA/TatE family subunit [Solirubrobacterales bacterium]|nr:MAG: twin-arginine translocase TatA/TatE family subunit [Solirubrobacterales bacterium]